MPNTLELSKQFRAAILSRERKASVELLRAYGIAYKAIKSKADSLIGQIEKARESGIEVNRSWLQQRDRLKSLQGQVRRELDRFADSAIERIAKEQIIAVTAAQIEAESLIVAALGSPPAGIAVEFASLPKEAIQNIVGFLGDGSPLRDALNGMGAEAANQIGDALISGVALGEGPRKIAGRIRKELGVKLTDALRLSRTITLNAYREASIESYRRNSDVVTGWVWLSGLGPRTCASCYATHGSFHELSETLNDHHMGRCSMLPVTKTWAELGFPDMPDNTPQVESGESAFLRLPDADKCAVLGSDAALRAFKEGAVSLQDFSGTRRDAVWGTMRYRRSLEQILGERARAYRAAA